MPKGIDQALLNTFKKICACPNEEERIKGLIHFFRFPLSHYPNNFSDYQVTFLSENQPYIQADIKDISTGCIYSAKYENNPLLARHDTSHVKHIIVRIFYPENVEREITLSRFDALSIPLHEEIHAEFSNKYRLTEIRKLPAAYLPYEVGVYRSLSEIETGKSLYYKMVSSDYDCFNSEFFISKKDNIFEYIMKELDG